MTKRKQERRELLKEDDILSFLEKIARYIERNPRRVILETVLALAALALVFGMLSLRQKNLEQSARALYQAEKILNTRVDDEQAELRFADEKEKNEAALAELNKVIEKESGVVHQQAVIYKISCLINLGRNDELGSLYQSLIDEKQGLEFIGAFGLADKHFAEGQYKEALDQYSMLLNMRGQGADMADLVSYKMAQCYQGSGDLTSAKQKLSALINKYANKDEGEKHPILAKAQDLLNEMEKQSGTDAGENS